MVALKQKYLLDIQQKLESAINKEKVVLLTQEKLAKKELDQALFCQHLFWEEKAHVL